MTDTKLTGLEELESRAMASEEDRPAWLAARRSGITATEVRDLYLRKITVEKLIARKLGRIPEVADLSHVPIIGWGKRREPEIAEEVLARYGMRPERRVFRAADDPRKLASPDGVGENFDGELQIAEIKTHGLDQDITYPSGADYTKKGYFAQKVWQMRVIGARRCLYATEERLPDGTWFQAGEQRFWWVEWGEKALALGEQLERIANDFLAALDKAAAEPFDGPVIDEEIDEEIDTLAVNYLRGLELEREAKDLKEPAYRDLFARLDAGEPVVQESPLARVSFTPAVVEEQPVTVTDVQAATAADPELYARLERAQDDASHAMEALDVESRAVAAHEAGFRLQMGTERVVVKKASLRVTPGKAMKANG